MTERIASVEDEIASLGRRADQACSIHACLRDRYTFRAQVLDYGLMAASTYLLGLSFVEPVIGVPLSFGTDPKIMIALLSLATFFFSIVQFKNEWKTLAQAHADALFECAAVKSDCRAVTKGTRAATIAELQRIRARYDQIADTGTHIPEREFVRGKARHLRKVYISKYLDSHPGARPWVVSLKMFLRDNLGIDLLRANDDDSTSQPRG